VGEREGCGWEREREEKMKEEERRVWGREAGLWAAAVAAEWVVVQQGRSLASPLVTGEELEQGEDKESK
jgi:hypothetical protein